MSTNRKKKENLWAREFISIQKIGIPLLLTQLLVFTINVIDVVMIGRLGPDYLAAASLGLVLFTTIWLFAAGPAYAVSAIVAQMIGNESENTIAVRKTIQMGLWAIVSILPIALIIILFSEFILSLFGVSEELGKNARAYMLALAPSFIFSLSLVMLRGFLATIDKTIIPLWIVFFVTILNVFLNYLLIYGNFGLPKLELVGAGIATTISGIIGFIVLAIYISNDRVSKKFKIFHGITTFDREQFKEVWSLGFPIGIDLVFEVMLFNVFAILMAKLGTDEVASYHVVFNVAQISYMMVLGMSMAGATRTGLAAGEGSPDKVRRIVTLTVGTCLAIASIFILPTVIYPEWVASFYVSQEQMTQSPNFYQMVLQFFPIVGLIVVLDAIQMGANQCTRALKDAKVPMLLTGFSYWLIGVPTAIWLGFYQSEGAYGLWIGMLIALISDALLQGMRAFWITRKGSNYLSGVSFKDPLEGIETPEMITIPPGAFVMGSPEDEAGRNKFSEGEQKYIEIDYSFAVSRHCITFEEYDAFCRDRRWATCGDEGWGRGRRPVINVSWFDAKEYVKWLSAQTGKNYRLLSETEWEYCCRANSSTPFSFGKSISTDQVNYNGSESYENGEPGEFRGTTTEAGTFPPNKFGLCDLHGNVWEWVEDMWNEGAEGIPTDGSPAVHGQRDRRVLRGGSWYSVPALIRSANRVRYVQDFRDDDIGFRVARDL